MQSSKSPEKRSAKGLWWGVGESKKLTPFEKTERKRLYRRQGKEETKREIEEND
jgi:hypothetical protein